MAIQDSFNLDRAIGSQAYAYKCWYNYNYGNNTMGISAKDYGEITQTWNSELKNWHANAMDDENAYEIEDDDFNSAYNDGKENAKEKTEGYEDNAGNDVQSGLSILGSAASLTLGSIMCLNSKLQGANSRGMMWAAAGLNAAVIAGAIALNPNKAGKEACDQMQDEMVNAQNGLNAAQGDMATMSSELEDLSDEANVYNEDANEDMEENKAEYDMYKASYDALVEKVESGETLTEDEQALLQELMPLMQELGVTIEETSEDTTEAVEEIYDEMGTYQEGYDNAASTVAEVQGLTDYAASFDEDTKNNCTAMEVAMSINTAASGVLMTKLIALPGTIFTKAGDWIFAGVAAATGVLSGLEASKQAKMAGDVGTEIDMRQATQDMNSATSDIYNESVDIYSGQMSNIEDLEMEIPETTEETLEDMELPEEGEEVPTGDEGAATASAPAQGESSGFGIPTQTSTTTGTSTGFGIPAQTGTQTGQGTGIGQTPLAGTPNNAPAQGGTTGFGIPAQTTAQTGQGTARIGQTPLAGNANTAQQPAAGFGAAVQPNTAQQTPASAANASPQTQTPNTEESQPNSTQPNDKVNNQNKPESTGKPAGDDVERPENNPEGKTPNNVDSTPKDSGVETDDDKKKKPDEKENVR